MSYYTTNLCKNPSFQAGLTGYSSLLSANISLDSSRKLFGAAKSLKVVTEGRIAGEGVITANGLINSNAVCSASIFLQGTGKVNVSANVNPGGTVVGTTPVTLTGNWQRVTINNISCFAGQRLYITVYTPSAKAVVFWISGIQIEPESLAHAYCDGDQPGCEWLSGSAPSISVQLLQTTISAAGSNYSSGNIVDALEQNAEIFIIPDEGNSFSYGNLVTIGAEDPVALFDDFAIFELTDPDPAQTYANINNIGNSGTAGAYNRIFATFYPPSEYLVSNASSLWNRGARLAAGFQFANVPSSGTQEITDVQVELLPMSVNVPSSYELPRQINTIVRPNRLNFCPNPSMETSTAGWTAIGSASLTSDSSVSVGNLIEYDDVVSSSDKSLNVTINTSGDGAQITLSDLIVGQTYIVSAYVQAGAGFANITMACANGAGSAAATGSGDYGSGEYGEDPYGGVVTTGADLTTGIWYRPSFTFTAASSSENLIFLIAPGTDITYPAEMWIDAVLVELGEDLQPYFDGNFGPDYFWEDQTSSTVPAPAPYLIGYASDSSASSTQTITSGVTTGLGDTLVLGASVQTTTAPLTTYPIFGIAGEPDGTNTWSSIESALGASSIAGWRGYNPPSAGFHGVPLSWPGGAAGAIPAGVTLPVVSIKPDISMVLAGTLDTQLATWFASVPSGAVVTLWAEGEASSGQTPANIIAMHKHAYNIFKANAPAGAKYAQIFTTYTGYTGSTHYPLNQWVCSTANSGVKLDLYGFDWYPNTNTTNAVNSITPAITQFNSVADSGSSIAISETNYTTGTGITWTGTQAQWFTDTWSWATSNNCEFYFPYFDNAHSVNWPPSSGALTELTTIYNQSTGGAVSNVYIMGSGTAGTGVSTINVPITTPSNAGDNILVIFSSNSGAMTSISDSHNTYTTESSETTQEKLYAALATGTVTQLSTSDSVTVNWSGTASDTDVVVIGISGLISSPLDQVPTPVTNAGSTTPSITSGTLTDADEICIAVETNGAGGGAISWAGGWTSLYSQQAPASSQWTAVAYQTVSSTSPVTASGTIVSNKWGILLLTFKLSPPPSSVTVMSVADTQGNTWTQEITESTNYNGAVFVSENSAILTPSDHITITYSSAAAVAKNSCAAGTPNVLVSGTVDQSASNADISAVPSVSTGTISQANETVFVWESNGNSGGNIVWSPGITSLASGITNESNFISSMAYFNTVSIEDVPMNGSIADINYWTELVVSLKGLAGITESNINLSRSYFYDQYAVKKQAVINVLDKHVPLGISYSDPKYKIPYTQE